MRESRKPPPFRSLEDSVLRGFFCCAKRALRFFIEILVALEVLEALEALEVLDVLEELVEI